MGSLSLHGYFDPSLPRLDDESIHELNIHAAKDLALRTLPGGMIVLLALIISAWASPILDDAGVFTYSLFSIMMLMMLMRFYTVHQILKNKVDVNKWRQFTFGIFIVSAAVWGIYVGVSLYLYGSIMSNMVIIMFTIGIGAGAASALFIWQRLALVYLLLIFVPIMVATTMNWQVASASILFGLTAYFLFLSVQTKRTNAEYWRALCLNKLLQKQTEELIEARDQAEKASQAKTEFLSSMSHELRTPLNAILGFTQLLKSDNVVPPTTHQNDSLDHILRASDHLLTLINQVLDLAKIEAGRLELKLTHVDVNKIVHECLPLIHTLAKEKEIQLNIAKIPPDRQVIADAMRLKQALINLLSNGIKYNHRRGQLSLDYEVNEHSLKIKITDTGIGISEKHQQDMFRSFSRLGQENSSTEGSGVGLVITKSLLEAMNGSLDFRSTEGEGSCFWFELPLVIAEPAD